MTITLLVTPPAGAPAFSVRLAPDTMGGITTTVDTLRFHISAADAQAMLLWPCLPSITLAAPLRPHFASTQAALRHIVTAKTAGRSHVLLGQWVLHKIAGGYVYHPRHGLVLLPDEATLRLGTLLQPLRPGMDGARATFGNDLSMSQENMDDWVDEDHDADAAEFDPEWEMRLFQDS